MTQPRSVDPTAIEIEFDPLQQRMCGVAVHGNTPFDVPYISEIEEGFYQGGCANMLTLPRNIDHLVSLYPWEQYDVLHDLGSRLEIRMFDSVRQAPPMTQVIRIAKWVNECREQGPTLVHCQAGLNRSSLVAATSLILRGMSPQDAVAMLREARSPAVLCNPRFEHMVLNFNPTEHL